MKALYFFFCMDLQLENLHVLMSEKFHIVGEFHFDKPKYPGNHSDWKYKEQVVKFSFLISSLKISYMFAKKIH